MKTKDTTRNQLGNVDPILLFNENLFFWANIALPHMIPATSPAQINPVIWYIIFSLFPSSSSSKSKTPQNSEMKLIKNPAKGNGSAIGEPSRLFLSFSLSRFDY